MATFFSVLLMLHTSLDYSYATSQATFLASDTLGALFDQHTLYNTFEENTNDETRSKDRERSFFKIDMKATQQKCAGMDVKFRVKRTYYVRVLQKKVLGMIHQAFPNMAFHNFGGIFFILENTIQHEYLNELPAAVKVRLRSDALYAYCDIWGPGGEALPEVIASSPEGALRWITARTLASPLHTGSVHGDYRIGLAHMFDAFEERVAVAWHYDIFREGGIGTHDTYPHITTIRIPLDPETLDRHNYNVYLRSLALRSA
ncbi:MAG: hypothetical protein JW938_04710 [Candidatus Omnitrophica bacterium]|nr:hypothetical protein [Candidatus Omnitrophota bacterium]